MNTSVFQSSQPAWGVALTSFDALVYRILVVDVSRYVSDEKHRLTERFVVGCVLMECCAGWRWMCGTPRARGKHQTMNRMKSIWNRDSPRAWETRNRFHGVPRMVRDSPARVENTGATSANASRIAGLPRARGKHGRRECPHCAELGTPPRAWKTRWQYRQSTTGTRDSPARVENTHDTSKNRILSAGLPRARGKHSNHMSRCNVQAILPPLAWGTFCQMHCVSCQHCRLWRSQAHGRLVDFAFRRGVTGRRDVSRGSKHPAISKWQRRSS